MRGLKKELKNIYECEEKNKIIYPQSFKEFYKKVYKKAEAFKLCSEFVDKLPEGYFEKKGITCKYNSYYEDDLSYIKNVLSQFLYCQCLLGFH